MRLAVNLVDRNIVYTLHNSVDESGRGFRVVTFVVAARNTILPTRLIFDIAHDGTDVVNKFGGMLRRGE